MTDGVRELAERYAIAIQEYLSEPEELALARAYELGRTAFAGGLGVLEMAIVHSRAVSAVLTRQLEDDDRIRMLEALEKVFVETLSAFEMAHRGFRDANAVLHRLNEMLEGQAKRIAYALHDEAAQLLASVHLGLADVANKVPEDTAREILSVRGLLDQIEERLRQLAHELRPPILDDLGLVSALEFLADGVSKRWGFPVTVQASIPARLPATVETTLYRITQEALTNAAKHAKASRVEVQVCEAAHRLVCSIRDDGIGFDVTAPTFKRSAGLGLMGINERVAALGGILLVGPNRRDGRGTDLTVEIPLENQRWA